MSNLILDKRTLVTGAEPGFANQKNSIDLTAYIEQKIADAPVSDAVQTALDNLSTYTKYVALLTQSGTNAPTAVTLENTTGLTFSFTYDGVGRYSLVPSEDFPVIPAVIIGSTIPAGGWFESNNQLLTSITLYSNDSTGTGTNGKFSDTLIEVRLY